MSCSKGELWISIGRCFRRFIGSVCCAVVLFVRSDVEQWVD